MQYLVYRIINVVNNKVYVGCHKTNDVNDGYMGSGLLIKRAIKKYGNENFKKEILFNFNSAEEMFSKEKELVEISDKTYNLKYGGEGGWDHIKHDAQTRTEIARNAAKHSPHTGFKGKHHTSKTKAIIKAKCGKTFLGKKHTLESRKKISVANKISTLGSRNSQFGTRWITDGTLSKKIKNDEVVPTGWKLGRKI